MEPFIRSEESLLANMAVGCTLHREHTDEGDRYFLNDGRTVHANAVNAALTRGKIEPCGDDLFGGVRKHSADLPACEAA